MSLVPPNRPLLRARRAFTLTEILVVIVIIVLILGMAVPALRFITGSRSQAGAANMISAELARARNDAIGLQVPTGVCFYTDPTTGRTTMAEVQQVQFSGWNPLSSYSNGQYVSYVPAGGTTDYYVCVHSIAGTSSATTPPNSDTTDWIQIADNATYSTVVSGSPGFSYLIDQISTTDAEPLPTGVGAQVLNDAGQYTAGTNNPQDRYLHTGVILFDANGRLTVQPYWMTRYGVIGTALAINAASKYDVAQNDTPAVHDINAAAQNLVVAVTTPLQLSTTLVSSVGLVTFDRDAFSTQNAAAGDYIIDGTAYSAAKDAWLDTNATPLLVNRYNGTLMNNQ